MKCIVDFGYTTGRPRRCHAGRVCEPPIVTMGRGMARHGKGTELQKHLHVRGLERQLRDD